MVYYLIVPLHPNLFFFFNDTATTEIYTLSLHDALPISPSGGAERQRDVQHPLRPGEDADRRPLQALAVTRSEEHTSELQSRQYLVCRLLLEKKKQRTQEFTCGVRQQSAAELSWTKVGNV